MTQPLNPPVLIRSFTPASGPAVEVGTINVLLGPQNVGKSEALRDLARLAANIEPLGVDRVAGEEPHTRVIQDLAFVPKLTLDRLVGVGDCRRSPLGRLGRSIRDWRRFEICPSVPVGG
jgi:hypothetical protein